MINKDKFYFNFYPNGKRENSVVVVNGITEDKRSELFFEINVCPICGQWIADSDSWCNCSIKDYFG